MREPLRLAVVGCGEVTLYKHLPALKRLPEWTVAAVADPDPAAREAACRRFAIPRGAAGVEELLALPEIDAIAVSVPPSAHPAVAMAALRAGKHVWIDKPLALTAGECRRIAEEAERSAGRVLMGFHMRWHPLVREARQAIRGGALGEIESVRSVWNSPRDDDGLPEWRWRRESGGGALIEIGVHHFDLWRFLLDREVEEVRALSRGGSREDESAAVLARLEGGVAATLMLSERSPHQIEIEICGRLGRLRVDCLRFEGLELSTHRDVPGGPATRLRAAAGFLRSLPRGIGGLRHGGDYRESYRAAWAHFARVIRGGEQPGATLEDGLRATGIALAAAGASGDATGGNPAPAEDSRGHTPGRAPEPAPQHALEFSVVVPTYDRPARLPGLLAALRAQRFPKERFEVVIVDDGGASPLDTVVEPYRKDLSISLIRAAHGGCASARQQGALCARGHHLAFTDDDCLPAPDWLAQLDRARRRHPGMALGGGVACSLPENPFSVASHMVVELFTAAQGARYFPTMNLTLPAGAFHDAGGMDAGWANAGGEDRDLCRRWIESGRQMIAAPEAVVSHGHPLSLRTFWLQHFRYGRGAALMRRAHPREPFEHWRFYLGLLAAPFRRMPWRSAAPVAALAALSQAANLCGYAIERLRPRPGPEMRPAPRPGPGRPVRDG